MSKAGQNHKYIYIYIYGVYAMFLAGKSPNIQSYTLRIHGAHIQCLYTVHVYGHIRCVYTVHIYGAHIRCTYTVHIYGHIRCVYTVHIYGANIRSYTLRIHGAHIRFWPTLVMSHEASRIYMVYMQYVWQDNHQIYGHIRCVYTVHIYGSDQP
jgi:hypothetical protein